MISRHTALIDSDLFRQVCGEFLEMPGLQLSCEQAMRLWGLDRAECTLLLDVLVNAHFLCHSRHGTFKRSTEGQVECPRSFALPPDFFIERSAPPRDLANEAPRPDTAHVDGHSLHPAR